MENEGKWLKGSQIVKFSVSTWILLRKIVHFAMEDHNYSDENLAVSSLFFFFFVFKQKEKHTS